MRKFILAGATVLVIGTVGAGIAVTRADEQPDPQLRLLAADLDAEGGPLVTPGSAGQLDPDEVLAALTDAPPPPPGAPADEDMLMAQAGPAAGGPPGGPGAPPPPPPPPAPRGMPPRPGPGWMHGPMQGGWGHRMMWHRAAMFGLFFHKDDKQLTPADVQKIAEAFLLWQGNRDWKVTQVAAGPDGKIGFAFATSDGGVIARFTMDSRTGRIQRVG
jgi:hypothetical protein